MSRILITGSAQTASSTRQRSVCSQILAPSPPSPAYSPSMSRSPSTMSRDHVDEFVADLPVADLVSDQPGSACFAE